MKKRPNPGSPAARELGCRCPILDNAHGKGYLGGMTDSEGNLIFVISAVCPLHGNTQETSH